jgi:lipopolysaccharide export LptBFGC system permease protein LptF
MAFSVTYTKEITTTDDPVLQVAPVSLVLTVTAVSGFTDFGVFVWIQDTATQVLRFSNVATPLNLEEYNFQVIGDKDFVRLGYVNLTFNRADQAEEAADAIEATLQQLCIDMQLLQDFESPVTITVSS